MPTPLQRQQQTIARSAKVSGFGLFGGIDVVVEFCPADTGHGIVFERIDLAQSVQIPALIEYVIPQPRCTVISNHGVTVSVIEHVMAALAGLHVDNCLVRINAPEPPACDGSSRLFVEALLEAGIVQQDELREVIVVDQTQIVTESDHVGIGVQSSSSNEYEIGSIVDYGKSPISRQSVTLKVTPETFINEISNARTFVLEQEVSALQSKGIGLRATPQNVLVFGEEGVIENSLRYEDECARHKILDCIGDFALIGCDLIGRFSATQSGHRLNHAIIREIKAGLKKEKGTPTLSFIRPSIQNSNQCRAAG